MLSTTSEPTRSADMTNTPPASSQADHGPEEDAGGDVDLRAEDESVSDTDSVEPQDTDEEESGDIELAPLPQHPLLLAAHRLFEYGDNRAATETLSRIGDDAPEDVRAARDALRARIRPDRFTLIVAAACVVLGGVIAYLAIST